MPDAQPQVVVRAGLWFRLLVLAGSFLLFQLELIAARLLLPGFGSSASVWTTCLLFYQVVLFLGYLYAGRASAAIRLGRYRWAHLVLLAAGAAAFPFRLVHPDLPPIAALLVALALSVGPAFLVLSTTSVVAQSWFATTGHPRARDPFFLYGTSNLGALLALLTYPFLVEPLLDLPQQLWCWYAGYGGFVLLHLPCVPRLPAGEPAPRAAGPRPGSERAATRPGPAQRGHWLLLAAAGNALLMAVSEAVGLEAPLPLFWMVPLALYLLTLILCFSRSPPSETRVGLLALGALVLAVPAVVMITEQRALTLAYLTVHLLVLFAGCLLVHSRLMRARPSDPGHLGEFYLQVALGGVVGGVATGLLVPLLLAKVALPHPNYAVAVLLLAGAVALAPPSRASSPARALRRRAAGAAVFATVSCGAGLLAWWAGAGDVHFSRTFYGHYTVQDEGGLRWFRHGNTVHGVERLDSWDDEEPLGYYHHRSAIGRFFLGAGEERKRVAVVGLGAGSLGAYSLPGERWDFFELDPEVEVVARRYFGYLAAAAAQVQVIPGDARLSLGLVPDGVYDVLVVDAFSSDFVPVHLITAEALELYLRKLRPGGVILIQVTSRSFDLRSVLARSARELSLAAFLLESPESTAAELAAGRFSSVWLAIPRTDEGARRLTGELGWTPVQLEQDALERRQWTDSYMNVFHALALPVQ